MVILSWDRLWQVARAREIVAVIVAVDLRCGVRAGVRQVRAVCVGTQIKYTHLPSLLRLPQLRAETFKVMTFRRRSHRQRRRRTRVIVIDLSQRPLSLSGLFLNTAHCTRSIVYLGVSQPQIGKAGHG